MNLLINAAHAIQKQGVIYVRTGCDSKQVWVEVIDDGAGVSPDNMNRIFDPFFTTEPRGNGTTFHVALPIDAQPVNPPATSTRQRHGAILELRNFFHRVKRRVGEQVGGGFTAVRICYKINSYVRFI